MAKRPMYILHYRAVDGYFRHRCAEKNLVKAIAKQIGYVEPSFDQLVGESGMTCFFGADPLNGAVEIPRMFALADQVNAYVRESKS